MTRETLVSALLTLITTAVAVFMVGTGRASWLEGISFVTGAVCVWLTVKESVWNFPIGLLNVATFSVVFLRAQLYADAGLQVVYFVLGVVGWYLWLYGGENRGRLHVSRLPRAEGVIVVMSGVAASVVLTWYLRQVGGSAPFWDATTTAMSLCAQWLLNRKYLESWYLWIAVDVLYVPLYVSRSLHLTAALYAVFLCMAILGLLAWRAAWMKGRLVHPPVPRGLEAPA